MRVYDVVKCPLISCLSFPSSFFLSSFLLFKENKSTNNKSFSVAKVSSNFCTDGDSIFDSSADSNRTTSNSSEELESAFHQDGAVEHRLNLSDMETQFPAVNTLARSSLPALWNSILL